MRRRSVVLWFCSLCLIVLVLPFAASAQEEEAPVPFTQIVTSDGLITMAHPTAWTIQTAGVTPGTLVFLSDASLADLSAEEYAASSEVGVSFGFVPTSAAELGGMTGATAAEKAEQVRDWLIQRGENGEDIVDVSDVTVLTGGGLLPDIASISLTINDQFTVFYLWEPADGLLASAWAYTTEESWLTHEEAVAEMVRSVRYTGPDSLLQAEGSN